MYAENFKDTSNRDGKRSGFAYFVTYIDLFKKSFHSNLEVINHLRTSQSFYLPKPEEDCFSNFIRTHYLLDERQNIKYKKKIKN